ncbi:MAG: DUF3943 domain-containing protein [Spirochaetaceae bacterium]|nr:DUF3943 domain-containing protein [Spirochaetaceae bacterium]
MKKLLSLFFVLLLLCADAQIVFSYSEESPGSNKPQSTTTSGTLKRGLIASGEALLSNFVLMTFNIFVTREAWSTPSRSSIYNNFTLPWVWDNDGYRVNQLGHAYQGAMYFSAGRANGFGFYQSLFFSALGSATWEIFCESVQASKNDVITTVGSSMALGEMLYRLYLEACSAGAPAPAAFIINPVAGFHRLVTGWEPEGGGNIYKFNTYLGMGWAQTSSLLLDADVSHELFSFSGLFANVGFSTIYGNPFFQETFVPFRHFELSVFFGIDVGNYMSIRLISDGYLFAFSPVYTATSMMSTGLSLHLDFVSVGELDKYDSTVDQFSNALNWTVKYQRLFGENMIFETKAHLGVTFMGSSKSYPKGAIPEKKYGYGFNSKKIFALENKKRGRFELSVFNYILCGFFNAPSSLTNVYWLFVDSIYYHFLSRNLSLAIANFFAMERGFYESSFYNTRNYNNELKLFAVWRH